MSTGMKTMCQFSCHDLNPRGSGVEGEAVKEHRKIHLFHVYSEGLMTTDKAFWNHRYRQPKCLKWGATNQLRGLGKSLIVSSYKDLCKTNPRRRAFPGSTTNLLTAEEKALILLQPPAACFTMLSANLGLISEYLIMISPHKGCNHEIQESIEYGLCTGL